MNQKNDNFIDKTFTVLADILLKVLPVNKDEKQAFSYYRYGMSAQSSGDYAEALENYYEALKLEEDPYDRSYILYNIGLIYSNNGDYSKALEYYQQALELNARLPQALNNIAVIYHYQGTKLSEKNAQICVVGDDDQSIYGWRGADITNILDFEKFFPSCRIFTLEKNYRSTQQILDAATAVVTHNDRRAKKTLSAENGSGDPLGLIETRDELEESDAIISALEKEIKLKIFLELS